MASPNIQQLIEKIVFNESANAVSIHFILTDYITVNKREQSDIHQKQGRLKLNLQSLDKL